MYKISSWIKKHKIWSIVLAFLFIGLLGSAGTNNKTTPSKTSHVTASSGSPKYVAVLYNISNASSDDTPNTLPAAGWDANDGWDTQAQAKIDNSSTSDSTIQPAVIRVSSHEIDVNVNVHNVGTISGNPVCTAKAEANYPNSINSQQLSNEYYGISSATIYGLSNSPIDPGQYGNGVIHITITNQGAQYINKITLSC